MGEPIRIFTEKKIDAAGAPRLGEKLNEVLDGGCSSLIIDMKDTVYISSVGLRVFLAAQKKIKARKGSMVLLHVLPQVMEVFDITGFSGLLTFGEDE
ncbi:MAG: STAS domain-containing protein [Eubacteriales bacterium]|nr:STAS domain-containing protein [Eubacteriales bacterium]